MGITKQNILQKSKMSWQLSKAPHPARIAIIQHLIKAAVFADIVNELPLAQPTVSQHLKELKKCRTHQRKFRRKRYLLLSDE
jgi:DNA-binding transcriptional ArsR family regulator